jgi:hypothetical protein
MPRKVTDSGLFAYRPAAATRSDKYYFSQNGVDGSTPGTGAYYYSDGYTWTLKTPDLTDIDPFTDASVICGVSPSGGINPLRISANGGIGGGSASFTDLSGSTEVGSKLIAAENPNRKFLYFQNISPTSMYLGIGNAANPNSMQILANGGGVGFDVLVPTNAIYTYCESAGERYVCFEA